VAVVVELAARLPDGVYHWLIVSGFTLWLFLLVYLVRFLLWAADRISVACRHPRRKAGVESCRLKVRIPDASPRV